MLNLSGALSKAEPSLWQEIWNYIYNNYFSPDAVVFENLSFGDNTAVTLRNIVLGLFVGIIAASLFIVIDKRVLGAFVRKLLREDCTSAEKAKRLYDLGFVTKYSIRNGVRRSSVLRSVVRCREEDEYYAALAEQKQSYEQKRAEDSTLPPFKEIPYRVDPDTDHFYIPEEKKYSAEMRFDKRGTTWIGFAMVIVVAIIGFAVLMFALPEILKLIDSFVGSFSGQNGNILT